MGLQKRHVVVTTAISKGEKKDKRIVVHCGRPIYNEGLIEISPFHITPALRCQTCERGFIRARMKELLALRARNYRIFDRLAKKVDSKLLVPMIMRQIQRAMR